MTLLITGGNGMVGNAFKSIGTDAIYLSSKDADLRKYEETKRVFEKYNPTKVIHLAAKVGGVKSNSSFIGDFYTDNIYINTNVLKVSHELGVEKVLSLMSTCVYPKREYVSYPLTEEQLHLGEPHETNFGYAYSKRMLDVQSRAYRNQFGCNFITAIPNNLYGEHDNFHLEDSHVIPAIMRKMFDAQSNDQDLVLWGDGKPLREFTYAQDIAKILMFLLENYNGESPINIGSTNEYSILEVSNIIKELMNFNQQVIWDTTKPKGQYKKPCSNLKLLELGWDKSDYTCLKKGLKKTYDWFIMNYPNIRGINV